MLTRNGKGQQLFIADGIGHTSPGYLVDTTQQPHAQLSPQETAIRYGCAIFASAKIKLCDVPE